VVGGGEAAHGRSVGCIFAELINKEPLMPGQSELDQLDKVSKAIWSSTKIIKLLGMPTEKAWPGFSALPHANKLRSVNQPYK
jgi:cell division cycle 2-like protein